MKENHDDKSKDKVMDPGEGTSNFRTLSYREVDREAAFLRMVEAIDNSQRNRWKLPLTMAVLPMNFEVASLDSYRIEAQQRWVQQIGHYMSSGHVEGDNVDKYSAFAPEILCSSPSMETESKIVEEIRSPSTSSPASTTTDSESDESSDALSPPLPKRQRRFRH
ncbi:uncharacterized protein LOC111642358 [Centruroides sculpturatus]|uniref:uncharacterized protein LOC111642358 n=1 Tax=Centruroides sculpturatus TaxID=218467 RepID=UPI000C6E72A8|nr:uncharacterized protein LOC111642358 [Centruroides sculpturatus]